MCNKLNQSPHKKNVIGPREDFSLLNPFNPKDDQQLISPYSNNAKSFKKIMRNEETITNVRSFDYKTNSPSQYQGKSGEEYGENRC